MRQRVFSSLFIFLFLGLGYLHSQETEITKDSLSFFNSKRNYFRKEKQYDSAIFYTEKMIPFLKQKDSIKGLAITYHRISYYHSQLHNYKESFKNLNTSFNYYKVSGDSINAAERLMSMAFDEKHLGDFTGSEIIALDALPYIENTNEVSIISNVYSILSDVMRHNELFDEALRWNSKEIDLIKNSSYPDLDKKQLLRPSYNDRALIAVSKGDYKKAISEYEDLLKDKPSASVRDNYGYARFLNNPSDTKALSLMLTSLKERKKTKDRSGLIASNVHLSEYYRKKDTIKAISYAATALENAIYINNPVAVLECLDIIIDLKKTTKSTLTEEAILYKETKQNLDDIIKANRNIYASTKYQNNQLRREREELVATKRLQEIEILKKTKDKQNAIYIAILSIVIGCSIYFLQRQRSKRRLLLERYNTERKFSKRVHDELANEVYNIMSDLETQNTSPAIVDKLDKIYKRTRDISKEYNEIDLESNYADVLESMLSSLVPSNTKLILKGYDTINWQTFSNEKKIELYRSLQELMVNMKRHSEATLVSLAFVKAKKALSISYKDNGKGFPKNTASLNLSGLNNVDFRIKAINGTFTFDKESRLGFSAHIKIPT